MALGDDALFYLSNIRYNYLVSCIVENTVHFCEFFLGEICILGISGFYVMQVISLWDYI